jgi:hypothetical protein
MGLRSGGIPWVGNGHSPVLFRSPPERPGTLCDRDVVHHDEVIASQSGNQSVSI